MGHGEIQLAGSSGQQAEPRGQKSEVGGQKSEVRSQRTEVRGRRSEVRGLRSGINLISDLRLLTSVIDDFYDSNGYGFDDLTS